MSESNKFTPGPWTSKKDGLYQESPWSIEHDDGNSASWAPITSTTGRTIALVVNDDAKRPMDFQEEEMHLNANLIAAAPDLLEALERMIDEYGTAGDGWPRNNKVLRDSRAAILKARGQQ